MNDFSWLRVAEGLGLGVVASVLIAVPASGLIWQLVGIVAVCTLVWILFATAY